MFSFVCKNGNAVKQCNFQKKILLLYMGRCTYIQVVLCIPRIYPVGNAEIYA